MGVGELKIMSFRQRVKREIFLRAENFVSDVLKPIYNKIFEFARAKKKSSRRNPDTFLRPIWQNKMYNLTPNRDMSRYRSL